LTMENVTMGVWYLGAYTTMQPCSFTVTLKPRSEKCLSECSLRGNCLPPCQCYTGYSGGYCQTRDASLINDQTDGGFVDTSLAHWYHYKANTNNNLRIRIEQVNSKGDCDVYIKHNQPPTINDYDDLDISNNTNFEIIVTDALQDTIYIIVVGYQACTYRIVVNEFAKMTTCTKGVNCIYGTCQGMEGCVCRPGYVGNDCGSAATSLHTGALITDVISTVGEWKYYQFRVLHPTFLVTMKEKGVDSSSIAYLYLLGADGRVPTLRDHDFAYYNPNNGFHTITVGMDNKNTTDFPLTIIVAVYGNPHLHEPVHFDLVAWQPDF